MLSTLRATLEFLGGERDDAPLFLPRRPAWLIRSTVWIAAILLIYVFCGQSSKFIYIDF
jgi:hypothetical protein